MISDLIVHPPLIPWSMFAWSCIGNDINRIQHSILFLWPYAMYPHDNTLLDQISWSNSSLIHGFHRIRWWSQVCSELGWLHLSPCLMSYHAFHMDVLRNGSSQCGSLDNILCWRSLSAIIKARSICTQSEREREKLRSTSILYYSIWKQPYAKGYKNQFI